MTKLLFLPGAGASDRFWKPVADLLTSERPTHFFAWPGLGNEPYDPTVRGIDELVGLVLSQMTEPCDLVAQSMGGVVAIKAALAAPKRVRRLVLTGTSGGLPVHELGGIDWRETYRARHPSAASWITEPTEDLSDRIRSIDVPALLLWGSVDRISPLAVGERLETLMPSATLKIIEGGDHDFPLTHAGVTARLIDQHLA